MKVVTGDIWDYPADVICITTNGTIKKNGEAVMGRGVALQAVQRFPGVAKDLGENLQRWGNFPHILKSELVTFPVKHHWHERASLDLIKESAVQFAVHVKCFPELIFVLPRPGCGNGGLRWEEVEPVISSLLPDNVHVIDRE